MSRGITIVGLGPGAPGLLTVEAREILESSGEIYLRTRHHPTVDAMSKLAQAQSFDHVYERGQTFDAVYAEIAATVVELGAREQGVVYAVPGHPRVGELSVGHVLRLAERAGIPVRLVEGLSFVEPLCTVTDVDLLEGVQIADAMSLAQQHHPQFNPDLPLLVGQLYSRALAADVKLLLMMAYPDDHQVALVSAAGTGMARKTTVSLYELDRIGGYDHLTSLYVPSLTDPGSLAAFQELVAHLRAPGGCPWDREQTHLTLRASLLEESYEVLQALDDEDTAALCEELGDLLLQILLHTQIAIETGEFKMADVVTQVVAKLRRRHPHVFGQVQVSGADEVLTNWERIKRQERSTSAHEGALSGVPAEMPALAQAQAIQRRAERLGRNLAGLSTWDAVAQRLQTLRGAEDQATREAIAGYLLFELADLARGLGIDAESALRSVVARQRRALDEQQDEAV